jgi:hypothetical protein
MMDLRHRRSPSPALVRAAYCLLDRELVKDCDGGRVTFRLQMSKQRAKRTLAANPQVINGIDIFH